MRFIDAQPRVDLFCDMWLFKGVFAFRQQFAVEADEPYMVPAVKASKPELSRTYRFTPPPSPPTSATFCTVNAGADASLSFFPIERMTRVASAESERGRVSAGMALASAAATTAPAAGCGREPDGSGFLMPGMGRSSMPWWA